MAKKSTTPAKKRASDASTTSTHPLHRLCASLAATNGGKTSGQLPLAEQQSLLASFVELAHQTTIHPDFAGTPSDQYIGTIEDWTESLGLSRDIGLAAQVALAEYGEFATPDEVDDCTLSNLIELIKVVAAKKQWERKLAAQSNPQSSGWPTVTPAELRILFDIEQDALAKRLKSQTIPNEKITSKAYRVDPSALPEGWKHTLNRQ